MGKFLVVGGAGFIGSHIVDELIKKEHEVFILDDLTRGFKENVNSKATLIEVNITDENVVNELFEREKFDYVIHLAAQSAIGLSNFIKKFNHETNVIGSINLINASIKNDLKCFVFISTIGVYGENETPFDEEKTIPNPQDPYSISKYAIELELKASKRMFDLDHIIFRPYNVYGERQDIGDPYRNVVGIFMKQLLEEKPLTLTGEGEQKFAFTYVGDIAPIIANSVFVEEARNQVFNLGADTNPNTIKELAESVFEAFGKEENIKFIPKRNEVKEAFSSIEKAKRVFGWEPKISLKEGIGRTAKWAKETGVKRIIDVKDYEIEKNLPDVWKKKEDKI